MADINASGANKKIGKWLVYPNPARDIIHVQVIGSAAISIINNDGKVMLTKMINNKGDIDVSNVASGTYFIVNKVSGETQKIVVIH